MCSVIVIWVWVFCVVASPFSHLSEFRCFPHAPIVMHALLIMLMASMLSVLLTAGNMWKHNTYRE